MSSISFVSIHQWWSSDFNHFLKIFLPLPLLMVCVAVAVPPARVQEAGSQLPSVRASPGEVQEPLCEWNTVQTRQTSRPLFAYSFTPSYKGHWWSVTLFVHRTRGTSPSCRSCGACSPSWWAPPAGLWIPRLQLSCCETPSGPARPNRCNKLMKWQKNPALTCAIIIAAKHLPTPFPSL